MAYCSRVRDDERETLRSGFGKLASLAIRAKESKGDASHLRTVAVEAERYACSLRETLDEIIKRDGAQETGE